MTKVVIVAVFIGGGSSNSSANSSNRILRESLCPVIGFFLIFVLF